VIINADDFGATASVNAAVAKARSEGVLTSASLMVTGCAVSEAVAIAKKDPGLSVGLHLALSSAKSVLPRSAIPTLVNRYNRFTNDPTSAALKYYFSSVARDQLKLEIEAQFLAFSETGLPLSHVDGHQHLHAHPVVLPIVVDLARKFGAKGIRVPREPFWASIRADASRMCGKAFTFAAHTYLSRVCRKRLGEAELAWCDVAIGGMMSGQMSLDYLTSVLRRVKPRTMEIYFHPALSRPGECASSRFGPNACDTATLTTPRFAEFLRVNGFHLTNYAGLATGENGGG
jgi:hopanoid biosynthesis associated protein HpnK